MKTLFLTPILILLQSCILYAGLGVHDTSFDSEYQEDSYIGTLGVSQELTEHIEIYFEHSSMPFYEETRRDNGSKFGVNSIGGRAKVKLF